MTVICIKASCRCPESILYSSIHLQNPLKKLNLLFKRLHNSSDVIFYWFSRQIDASRSRPQWFILQYLEVRLFLLTSFYLFPIWHSLITCSLQGIIMPPLQYHNSTMFLPPYISLIVIKQSVFNCLFSKCDAFFFNRLFPKTVKKINENYKMCSFN